MQRKLADHEKALAMRLQGRSYSQIRSEIGVSKSTLSLWLRDYPLSRERINELRARSERRIELFRATMRRKRDKRFQTIYEQERQKILPLSERDLYVAGLLLYAGEGAKSRPSTVMLANSNPQIIRFFLTWLTRCCTIRREAVRVRLQIYKDMNPDAEINFWREQLGLSRKQFMKVQIKPSHSHRINYRGAFNHGTCDLMVHNVSLFEKTMAGIRIILDSGA